MGSWLQEILQSCQFQKMSDCCGLGLSSWTAMWNFESIFHCKNCKKLDDRRSSGSTLLLLSWLSLRPLQMGKNRLFRPITWNLKLHVFALLQTGLRRSLIYQVLLSHCLIVDSSSQARGYSSVVERLTADQQVPSSTLGAPFTYS